MEDPAFLIEAGFERRRDGPNVPYNWPRENASDSKWFENCPWKALPTAHKYDEDAQSEVPEGLFVLIVPCPAIFFSASLRTMLANRIAFGIACMLWASPLVHSLTWNDTAFAFIFGDSYTTTGYNVSAGITSPDPGYTASNGPNWVEYLRGTYNVTDTTIYNFAYGGATTDSALVTPYLPTVESLVDQVNLWDQYFSPAPSVAPWQSNNTLFGIFIGINDVGNAWNTNSLNESTPVFFNTVIDRYFQQVDNLYQRGARNFLFLNVPPIDRAPLFIEQGTNTTAQVKWAIGLYNSLLTERVENMRYEYEGIGQLLIYDTNKAFTTLLDNYEAFSFTNITGYCEAYENGTPTTTTQVVGCEPVSTYFWLNTLHPLWFVHNVVAHGVSRLLS